MKHCSLNSTTYVECPGNSTVTVQRSALEQKALKPYLKLEIRWNLPGTQIFM